MRPPTDTILQGDALGHLQVLPDACVQCCVTSAPYFGLRDYGVAGQIGLEPTLREYLGHITAVFAEVRRVLRPDGTLWLNLGDLYANDDKWGGSTSGRHAIGLHGAGAQRSRRSTGLPSKSLVGLPWRVAFALQDEGWLLRSDIIWHKPNPMPESASDRPTRAHEYLFLFAKRGRYHYDADAIREPVKPKTLTTYGCVARSKGTDQLGAVKADNWARAVTVHAPRTPNVPAGWDTGEGAHGACHRQGRAPADKQTRTSRRHAGLNARRAEMLDEAGQAPGANKRDVWTIAPAPFPDAHFATFPPTLVEPCIRAGSRRGDLVLDPFMGSGTTAVVARQLGRHYLGIELSPAYCHMARQRIAREAPPTLWESLESETPA